MLRSSLLKYSIFLFICLIGLSCKQHTINYADDIHPIIQKNCTPCHKSGQIGHFNIVSYQDVMNRLKSIQYVIKNRIMPPWPADVHYSEFANQLSLSDAEISLFEKWVAANCPTGNLKQIRHTEKVSHISFYGKPDLSIPVTPTYFNGDAKDKFLLVKVPFELPAETTYAALIEFVPGNTKVVHHVNGDLVLYDNNKKQNIYNGLLSCNTVLDSSVRDAYKSMDLLNDDGSYPTLKRSAINYLPGVLPYKYPNEIGTLILHKKNAFLLSDIHYGPSVEKMWDSSYINIFFSPKPPSRTVLEFQLGTLGVSPVLPSLILQPNKVSEVYSVYSIDKKMSILTINPHMHLLGKSFKAFAVTPNNDTLPMIHIPKWDFKWQYFYTFKQPLVLEAGTKIYATGVYDNTEQNPFNPYHPPRLIKDNFGSMRTTDEMFQFIISYMDYQTGDEKIKL